MELYAKKYAMKIFPCIIDAYTIIKDFLTIIVIPLISILITIEIYRYILETGENLCILN
jgi:hypothetical protein